MAQNFRSENHVFSSENPFFKLQKLPEYSHIDPEQLWGKRCSQFFEKNEEFSEKATIFLRKASIFSENNDFSVENDDFSPKTTIFI